MRVIHVYPQIKSYGTLGNTIFKKLFLMSEKVLHYGNLAIIVYILSDNIPIDVILNTAYNMYVSN